MRKDYKMLSFLRRGKRRMAVLLSLQELKTPKEIAEECKISISNISNALAELIKKGYVICKTPEAHTYKYFTLTNKGKKAIMLLK
jgi:DNA-binding MarR family transcriptional regulator